MKATITLKILLLCLVGLSTQAYAQVFNSPGSITQALEDQRSGMLSGRQVYFGFDVGVSAVFGLNAKNFSELRFNASAGVSRAFGWDADYANFLGSYQIQLECFKGGVGSSLLGTERAKLLFEIRNIFQLNGGYVSNNPVYGRPLTKLVGHSESPLRDPFDYSIALGSMFVNGLNHDRNQQLGFAQVGILPVAVCYMNDGPFFHVLGLGDGYDRWWTGAGYAGVYFQNDHGFITEMSLQYQRYTGWQPNLYEMSNFLGIDYLSYKDKKEAFLNQGAWTYNVGIRNTLAIYFKFYEVKKLDIQNLLHISNNYTFHPNVLKRRYALGTGLLLNSTSPINL